MDFEDPVDVALRLQEEVMQASVSLALAMGDDGSSRFALYSAHEADLAGDDEAWSRWTAAWRDRLAEEAEASLAASEARAEQWTHDPTPCRATKVRRFLLRLVRPAWWFG